MEKAFSDFNSPKKCNPLEVKKQEKLTNTLCIRSKFYSVTVR